MRNRSGCAAHTRRRAGGAPAPRHGRSGIDPTVPARRLGPGHCEQLRHRPRCLLGFVGLATEYWNVEKEVGTDPNKPDAAFEQIVRNLAPYGGLSLRIGGDSTDWTWFPIARNEAAALGPMDA